MKNKIMKTAIRPLFVKTKNMVCEFVNPTPLEGHLVSK